MLARIKRKLRILQIERLFQQNRPKRCRSARSFCSYSAGLSVEVISSGRRWKAWRLPQMTKRTRLNQSPAFKAKVALAAVKGECGTVRTRGTSFMLLIGSQEDVSHDQGRPRHSAQRGPDSQKYLFYKPLANPPSALPIQDTLVRNAAGFQKELAELSYTIPTVVVIEFRI